MSGGNAGKQRLTTRAIEAGVKAPRAGQAKQKLADGGGLYLVRLQSGRVTWWMRYRRPVTTNGVRRLSERTYTIGQWPDVSLAGARAELRSAKDKLAKGSTQSRIGKPSAPGTLPG